MVRATHRADSSAIVAHSHNRAGPGSDRDPRCSLLVKSRSSDDRAAARDRTEARFGWGAASAGAKSPTGITALSAVMRPGAREREAGSRRHPGCTNARHEGLHHRKGHRPSSVHHRASVGTGLLSPVSQGADLWPALHVPRSPLRAVSGGRPIFVRQDRWRGFSCA